MATKDLKFNLRWDLVSKLEEETDETLNLTKEVEVDMWVARKESTKKVEIVDTQDVDNILISLWLERYNESITRYWWIVIIAKWFDIDSCIIDYHWTVKCIYPAYIQWVIKKWEDLKCISNNKPFEVEEWDEIIFLPKLVWLYWWNKIAKKREEYALFYFNNKKLF